MVVVVDEVDQVAEHDERVRAVTGTRERLGVAVHVGNHVNPHGHESTSRRHTGWPAVLEHELEVERDRLGRALAAGDLLERPARAALGGKSARRK